MTRISGVLVCACSRTWSARLSNWPKHFDRGRTGFARLLRRGIDDRGRAVQRHLDRELTPAPHDDHGHLLTGAGVPEGTLDIEAVDNEVVAQTDDLVPLLEARR